MGAVDAVIIGSGPAGLGTACELKRLGLEAVVLERGETICARWRSRYAGLRFNTFRAYSHLRGSPLPRAAGRYASREAFLAYLEDYARRNELDVRLGTEAERVERSPREGWRVLCSRGEWRSRHVVVAAGWNAEPNLPEWTTNSSFAGRLLHTSQLSDPAEFAGQRVLVVGAGNSGIDLAGVLVRARAQVTVSMRTPPNVFPRDWFGVPLGPMMLMAEHFPSWSVDLVGRFIQRQVYGDLSRYGLPTAPVGFMSRFRRFGTSPAVDDGFICAVKSGQARVVGEVERLDHDAALLVGGENLSVDCVICATGYRRGLDQLVGSLDALDGQGVPRFRDGAPCDPANPGLYFVGYRTALSGSIRVSAKQGRRVARAIATRERLLGRRRRC